MANKKIISGFSKLSRADKIKHLKVSDKDIELLNNAAVQSKELQDIIDQLSENTISNFTFPLGIVPNALINNKNYYLPLVTEESSVVAAISKAVKFWSVNGGFKAETLGTQKKGQVHFFWKGSKNILETKFNEIKAFLMKESEALTKSMKKRGGGILTISVLDKTKVLDYYYNIDVDFETIDAMGANFINSCLEKMAESLKVFFANDALLDEKLLDVNMAILSNYTPECLVKVSASCAVSALNNFGKKSGISNFAERFIQAVTIAENDVSRAVTHNKGIFNGVDALLLATANDWRAVEAGAHAYAAHSGTYRSLSHAFIENNSFTLEMHLPLAIGTIGGVTSLHPMAKLALKILGKPSASELMQIIAVSGLAANFSAVSALISTGIQKGHMKMHQSNMQIRSAQNKQA